MDYYCKACKAEVFVSDQGEVSRTCGHAGETIIAERTSSLFGEGGANERTLWERMLAAIDKLREAFR